MLTKPRAVKPPIASRRPDYFVPDAELETALAYARARGDKFARTNWVPSMERADIVQTAVLAVLKAAQSYNPDHPSKASFQSWAVTVVTGDLLEMCRKQSAMSRSTYDKVRLYLRGEAAGKDHAELVAEGGLAPSDVFKEPVSLDSLIQINPEGGHLFRELPDHAPGPEAVAMQRHTVEQVRAAMARLPDRWALILGRYYWEGKRMKAIAKELGISESRVFQIIQQAHTRLRSYLEGQL